jgi:hypothetical protein
MIISGVTFTAKDYVWRHALDCQDSTNMHHAMCKVFTLVSVEIMASCSLIDLCQRFIRTRCVHQHTYNDGGQNDLQKCGYISTRLHGITCHGIVNLMCKFTFHADSVLGPVIVRLI